jgi:DNA-binding CsgD family transcriptional regulator
MPVTRAHGVSPVLVGRAEELSVLRGLHRPARPQVVQVAGTAGIGKTRLLAEATAAWRQAGARVLVERCPAGGAAPPYLPLRGLLGDRPATGEGRLELFAGLAAVVDSRAARQWLVLVVEDLHWSDPATRDALAWLVTRPGRLPGWTLVLSQRHDPVGVTTAFWDQVASAVALRVGLEPLDVGEVAELAAAMTGIRPDPAAAERLHRRSGGIPLLVEEVTAAPEGVPDHLRAMLRARAAAGGPRVAEVLAVVAVAGECDEVLVETVLGLPAAPLAEVLDRAVHHELLEVDARGYRLRHELQREAVYDAVRPGRRRELHVQVAEVLAGRGADPAVLSRHWALAGRLVEAAASAFAAARDAESAHAPATAQLHLETVLAAWPRLPEEVRADMDTLDGLLGRAALAAERAGAFGRAAQLALARVEEPGAAAERAARWERVGRYRWEAGDGHGSRAAYREAVRLLPGDASPEVRAAVLSGLAWHLAATFEPAEGRTWAARALAAASGVTDARVLWQVRLAEGVAWLPGERSEAALEESCRLATALADGQRIALARMWLNISHQRLDRRDQREPNLRTALAAIAAEGMGSSMEAALRYLLAEHLLESGRWDQADAELALNLGRRGVVGIPALFSWGYRALLSAWRGEVDDARTALARTRELTAAAPQQPLGLVAALAAEALRLVLDGEPERAQEPAREALALGSVSPIDAADSLAVCCAAAADVAEIRRRNGQVARPDADLEEQVASLAAAPSRRTRAFGATCAAELSRWRGTPDPQAWRAAVAAWEEARDPFWQAIAQWRLAGVLVRDRSGRREAAVLLANARDTARHLGSRPLAGAVARTATRARLATDRGGDPAAAALTSRELDVLELLAAGRTNAQIAEHLVLSPRTVSTHVSRILRKLGATRRTEAADLAHRLGVLDGPAIRRTTDVRRAPAP